MSAGAAQPPAPPSARQPSRPLRAVLLDLDGTLLDTAPDMTRALNALRAEHALPPLALEAVRNHVSHGSSAVVRVGFPDAGAAAFETLRERFLALYRAALVVETRLFAGFDQVLAALDAHRVPWGIVTNKPGWLTEPLLAGVGLGGRAGCVVSGDSLPVRKPDPLPLLSAAGQLRVAPADCLYLGDALRDAQAARAAGMVGLGARYGYVSAHEELDAWPVTAWINDPMELLAWVGLAPPPPQPMPLPATPLGAPAAPAVPAAAQAPAPEAGSARYFMLLYSPPARRRLLTTLLALAAELGSGIVRRLDHGVAHVRLEWWREEARRLASGAPTHPWLRGLRERPADEAGLSAALAPLVEAAAQDLASERLAGSAALQLAEELFVQIAVALTPAELPPAGHAALAELGRCVAGLEEPAALQPRMAAPAPAAATSASAPPSPAAPLAWLQSRQRAGPLIEPALQPPLAPLLVWIAISARQAQRRARRAARKSATIAVAASPLDGFADNLVAWRCARSASRGEARIPIDERFG